MPKTHPAHPSEIAHRVADLGEICSRLKGAHYRLVWVVGGTPFDRSALLRELAASTGGKLLELGKGLSAALIDVAASLRAASVEDSFAGLLESSPAPILCLDHLEILFETSLRLNPMELLKISSRHRLLVASWPGSLQGDRIVFGTEEHPAHRKYLVRPFNVLLEPMRMVNRSRPSILPVALVQLKVRALRLMRVDKIETSILQSAAGHLEILVDGARIHHMIPVQFSPRIGVAPQVDTDSIKHG